MSRQVLDSSTARVITSPLYSTERTLQKHVHFYKLFNSYYCQALVYVQVMMILPSSAFSSGVSWVAIPEDILKQSCLLDGGWVINLIHNECDVIVLMWHSVSCQAQVHVQVRWSLITCQDWRPWRQGHPLQWGRQWGAHWRSHPQSPERWEIRVLGVFTNGKWVLPSMAETQSECHWAPSWCFSSSAPNWSSFGFPECSPHF